MSAGIDFSESHWVIVEGEPATVAAQISQGLADDPDKAIAFAPIDNPRALVYVFPRHVRIVNTLRRIQVAQ